MSEAESPGPVEMDDGVDAATGVRYLEPIVYEPGPFGGWIVPEHEQERWENPVRGASPRPPGFEPGAIPRELALLASDLGHWLFLDGRLRAMLDEAYERNPLRVTRMAERVIAAAKSGAIRSPDGLLASYLREDLPGSRS